MRNVKLGDEIIPAFGSFRNTFLRKTLHACNNRQYVERDRCFLTNTSILQNENIVLEDHFKIIILDLIKSVLYCDVDVTPHY